MTLVDEINDNKNYSEEVIKLFEKNDEFFKGVIKTNSITFNGQPITLNGEYITFHMNYKDK
jgi:hypothetical protein